jgi:hypothetical protein
MGDSDEQLLTEPDEAGSIVVLFVKAEVKGNFVVENELFTTTRHITERNRLMRSVASICMDKPSLT